MSYESLITIMTKQIQDQIENGIFKAVQDVGIFVDKVELVRALRYDRHQYEKGYNDRDAEIVRCKDCWLKECENRDGYIVCDKDGFCHSPEWFCADGKRKEADPDA